MGGSSLHDWLSCRHQHSGSVHSYSNSETRYERSICTLKDTYTHTHTHTHTSVYIYMIKLTSVANFGFIRFIWPCSDDSGDICNRKWDIKCPRNFQLPPWILPTEISRTRRMCISPIKYSLAVYQVLLCRVVFMKLSSGSWHLACWWTFCQWVRLTCSDVVWHFNPMMHAWQTWSLLFKCPLKLVKNYKYRNRNPVEWAGIDRALMGENFE